MKADKVVAALGALAQESRLAVFQLLVRRGPTGFSPGELADKLAIPAPTLSFHLKELQRADLVDSRRDGRFLYYSANFTTMRSVLGFLSEKCCTLTDDCTVATCKPVKKARA